MRSNLPVTQREFDFPANATLMSTTDIQGNITYANDAFIEVSGFSPFPYTEVSSPSSWRKRRNVFAAT